MNKAPEHTMQDICVSGLLDLLICPVTKQPLIQHGTMLVAPRSAAQYRISADGIPLFAEEFCSDDARAQQSHYEKIAAAYATNLGYPHTRIYTQYLDDLLQAAIVPGTLGTVAEVCCGAGEAFKLLGARIEHGIGVDVSIPMLRQAMAQNADRRFAFVQGDATMLPLADAAFDTVLMLGGIHHVRDRTRLFCEVARILKPGGHFYFREPVSDLLIWRILRSIIYKLSPALDDTTERPLRFHETEPYLRQAGLKLTNWRTAGFLGFCIFMNSDVLIFNRLFQYMPGIEAVTRLAVRIDEWTTSLRHLRRAGLQVIGVAQKAG